MLYERLHAPSAAAARAAGASGTPAKADASLLCCASAPSCASLASAAASRDFRAPTSKAAASRSCRSWLICAQCS